MRIVVDTNIYVAAGFNPRSSAARIIDAARDGRLTLIWNDATRRETKAIIQKIPPLNWGTFSDLFHEQNRITEQTHPQAFPVVEDRDDRKFAALADVADAILISNDDHLLSVRSQLEITVQTSSEFARQHLHPPVSF